jgi:catechol 2,3-dioxygenase-like lactoylglutathione lyase family enzyme
MSPDRGDPAAAGTVLGFDHIALPMRHTEATIQFYRSLGFPVAENAHVVQVYIGDQMINFHRPELWQGDFSLRAPAARPPCGDFCLVWDGSEASLHSLLDQAGAEIEEGPVARQGGRQAAGSSVYVRDPDGNLVEFMTYVEENTHDG